MNGLACAAILLLGTTLGELRPLKASPRSEADGVTVSVALAGDTVAAGEPVIISPRVTITDPSVEIENPFLEFQHPSVVRLAVFTAEGEYVGDLNKWMVGYDLQRRQTPVLHARARSSPVTTGRQMHVRAKVFRIRGADQEQVTTELKPGKYVVQAVVVRRLLRTRETLNVPGKAAEELCRSDPKPLVVVPSNEADSGARLRPARGGRGEEGIGTLSIVDVRKRDRLSYEVSYEYINTTSEAHELIDPLANQYGAGGSFTPLQFAWKDSTGEKVAWHPLSIHSLPGMPHRYDSLFVPAGGICRSSIVVLAPKAPGRVFLELFATESLLPHIGFPEEEPERPIEQSIRKVLSAESRVEAE